MELHIDDAGHVRAPVAATYRRLADVVEWPEWWPGTEVRSLGDGHERVALRVDGGRRLIRGRLTARGWRQDTGFLMDVTGDVAGTVEWWLEPGWGGVVVHHIASLRGDRQPLEVWRPWVRRGLWALKDDLQATVRDALTVPDGPR